MTTALATAADWDTYIKTAQPAGLDALLLSATIDVDRALVSAVYDITDTDVLAALAEATCWQAKYLKAQGASDGEMTGYTSVSIGSVSLARGKSSDGRDTPAEFSARAWSVLQQAGLTGHAPYTGY